MVTHFNLKLVIDYLIILMRTLNPFNCFFPSDIILMSWFHLKKNLCSKKNAGTVKLKSLYKEILQDCDSLNYSPTLVIIENRKITILAK